MVGIKKKKRNGKGGSRTKKTKAVTRGGYLNNDQIPQKRTTPFHHVAQATVAQSGNKKALEKRPTGQVQRPLTHPQKNEKSYAKNRRKMRVSPHEKKENDR